LVIRNILLSLHKQKQKNMEKIFVVIVPVDYGNSRKVCELIENMKFEGTAEIGKFLAKEEVDGSLGDIMIYELSDFMDGVNNQELDVLTDSFISYVRVGNSK